MQQAEAMVVVVVVVFGQIRGVVARIGVVFRLLQKQGRTTGRLGGVYRGSFVGVFGPMGKRRFRESHGELQPDTFTEKAFVEKTPVAVGSTGGFTRNAGLAGMGVFPKLK